VFDLRRRTVKRGSAFYLYTERTFAILLILAASQGRPVSTREIVQFLWADDPAGGPITAEKSVLVNMYRLRRTLGAFGIAIESRRGRRGFELVPAPAMRRAA
jgi:DNA-binding response OmpR family regulator